MKKSICQCDHSKTEHIVVDETKCTFRERTICEKCWLYADRPIIELCLGYEIKK